MDISELIIEVKNTNQSINQINKVNKALKNTSDTAKNLGKTIFASWSFTKILSQVKQFGDAWQKVQVTFRSFDTLFGKFDKNANKGVEKLMKNFNETEQGAKRLLNLIGSRVIDFGFSHKEFSKISSDLAEISEEIAAFYGKDVEEVSLKLTNALAGQTKGLREFGIVIDTTSPRFKALVQEYKKLGESDEVAKTLAIFKELQKASSKFQGTFKSQSKGLSQALKDIGKTLNDKIFAKIGQNLSKIFVPALKKLNEILSNQKVADIAGLVGSILTIGAALVALGSIIKNLKLLIGGSFLGQFGKAIIVKIGAMLIPILAKIGAVIAAITTAVIAGIAALPTAIVVAIGAALATIGLLITTKLSTGKWFDFSGLFSKIEDGLKTAGDKLADFFESIRNWINLDEFSTNKTILDKKSKELAKLIKDSIGNIDKIDEIVDEIINKFLKQHATRTITQKDIDELEKAKQKDAQQFRRVLTVRDEVIKKYKEILNEYSAKIANIELQLLNPNLTTKDRSILQNYLFRLQTEQEKWIQEFNQRLDPLNKDFQDLAKKVVDKSSRFQQYTKLMMLSYINGFKKSFSNLDEFKTNLGNIIKATKSDKSFYKFKLKDFEDSIESVSLMIKTLKDKFGNPDKMPKELKPQYETLNRQLSEMYMDKFNLEIDNIEKQKALLKESSDMIASYMEKIAQWSPKGVEGIRADSAEGYKVLTSEFGTLNSIKPAIQAQAKDERVLQQKANKIAEKTKQKLNEIYAQLKKLEPKIGVIEVQM